jgi:predicted TIM-barrel fold metal-dependent hydrolase
MIIDVHAHYFPEAYSALVEPLGLGGTLFTPRGQEGRPQAKFQHPPEDVAARLAAMDRAGVARQVLSIIAAPYFANANDAVRAARLGNDLLADYCAVRPDRFSFWASLPLPHVDAAIAEAERAITELGAVGVTIQCACLGESIARPEFDPLYARLNELSATVFLHPCQNALGSHLIGDWGLTVCAGASMEDAVAAMHLIARDHPARYPRLRFIVPHFGGIMPMLLERLDGQMPRDGLSRLPSETARGFFYDTVGWGSKAALIAAVTAFGAGQLVPGSDWPILLRWESYETTFDHIRDGDLTPDEVNRILHVNAQQLLAEPLRRSLDIPRGRPAGAFNGD